MPSEQNFGSVFVDGRFLSQEMLDLNAEIHARYPNLGLAWIPPENRSAEDTKIWAIVMNDEEGNVTDVITSLSSFECHTGYVLKWLYDNDSTRMDPFEKHMKIIEAEAAARRERDKEDIYERAEVIHSVAKSQLHTYRLNGRKIGAENEYPTLGLDEHDAD
jgi:hypothetical protein